METKINDFKSGLEFLGDDPNSKLDVSGIPERYRKYMENHLELIVMTEAFLKEQLGKEYKPDYTDGSAKYTPGFIVKADKETPSGSGFSGAHYGGWYSTTAVGSRLSFPTPELALHSAENWQDKHIINQLK